MPRAAVALGQARLRAAFEEARTAGPGMTAIYSRWLQETFAQVERQPSATRTMMCTQMAFVLEVLAERRRWPQSIGGR